MALIKCPKCGEDVSTLAKECIHCGYSLKKLKKCRECGEILDPGTNFCGKCGASITKKVSKAKPVVPQEETAPKEKKPKRKLKKSVKIILVALLLLIIGAVVAVVVIQNIDHDDDDSDSRVEEKETNTKKKEEEKKEEEKEPEEEMVNHTIGSLSYSTPKSWYAKESTSSNGNVYYYYYPNQNDTNAFLMIMSSDTGNTNIDQTKFNSFVDSFTSGIISSDSISNPVVNSKDTFPRGNYWHAKVSVSFTYNNVSRQMLINMRYNNVTGKVYVFSFTSVGNVSSENITNYNKVLSSIKEL